MIKTLQTFLLSGVYEQAEADQDHQQIDVSRFVPGFVHRVVYRLGLIPQNPVSAHHKYDS